MSTSSGRHSPWASNPLANHHALFHSQEEEASTWPGLRRDHPFTAAALEEATVPPADTADERFARTTRGFGVNESGSNNPAFRPPAAPYL